MLKYANRYPIAIDLSDPGEARALQLTGRGSVPVVRAAAKLALGSTGDEAQGVERTADFIRDVLRSKTFRGKSVSLLAPPGVVLSYPLRVELGKGEDLEAAIVRESAKALGFPVDEGLLDYVSVADDPGEDKSTRHVLLVAARKQDVSRYLDLVRQAGGLVEVVDCTASALPRVHALTTPLTSKPALLCDLGCARSVIVVVDRDRMLAHRSVPWGTHDLIRKLVENLDLGGKERDADFLLRKHGLLQAIPAEDGAGGEVRDGETSGTVSQLLAPLADELVHELHNMTGYVRSRAPDVTFAGIFLYGDASRVMGLDRYLEREMNMTVKVVNPLEKVGLSDARAIPNAVDGGGYALALGLGLRRVRWL